MKTIYLFYFIGMSCTLASCQWDVPKKKQDAATTDTLVYTYRNLHERAADCGDKPDSNCTVVKAKYPVFTGNKALNDSVVKKLCSLFAANGKADTTVEQMNKSFLKNHLNFKGKSPTITFNYKLDTHAHVLMEDSSLTTIEFSDYSFTGGAHGLSATYFINWQTKANKNLTLNDLLVDGHKDKLKTIAERIFRREEKLEDTSSLARDYFFKENKFALNNNYSITPLGLKFVYNQYEIKPYAAGITVLFIPYPQIKDLLRPNSVVAKYIR